LIICWGYRLTFPPLICLNSLLALGKQHTKKDKGKSQQFLCLHGFTRCSSRARVWRKKWGG